MARPRKPLENQAGHVTVNFQQARARAEDKMAPSKRDSLMKEHPDLINDDARKQWDVLAGYLSENNFYGDINVPDVLGYCNAYAMYLDAWRKLSRARKPEYKAAYMELVKKASEEMTRCQNRGGFSVSTRLQIGDKEAKDEKQELKDIFGL